MSDILIAEGFGNLSDGNHASGVSTEIIGEQWLSYSNTFALEDEGDGRKWIKNSGSLQAYSLTTGDLGDVTTISLCFRVYKTDASSCGLVVLYDGGFTMCHVSLNSSGQVEVGTGIDLGSGQPKIGQTVVATSSALSTGVETHVELKIVLGDGTSGSVAIYLNGVLDTTVPNIDTIYAGTQCDQAIFWGVWRYDHGRIPNGWKFTDFILHVAATPLGDCGVYYRPATSDGADADFTPSSGTDHYAMVDDIGPDDDTTYNESDGTAGHRDSFDTAGVTGLEIISVGVHCRARKTSTGTATLLLGAEHSGSEDQSSAKALSEDYANLIGFFDTNPSTASAWSSSEVSAAELTVEVGS